MIQTAGILIGSQGGDHVLIHNVTAPNVESWLGATIEVHCDGWVGRMGASFMKGELQRFAQEIRALHRNLAGVAKLQPLEAHLTLTLTGDGKGHIAVDGVAQNEFGSGTQLAFRFDIDQTFLNNIAEALSGADPAN